MPVEVHNHAIPHKSTVPVANEGERVQLFVRERDGTPPGHVDERTAVLMLHGRSIPVLPGFDLEYKSYSWARLAGKGRLPGLLQKAPAFTPGVSPARASSPVNG